MRRLLKIAFPPPPRICVRVLRLAAFNILLIVAALALIGVAGEAYFRLTVPYGFAANPKDFGGNKWRFVPNVGRALEPNSEVRYSNHRGYWVITQSNRFGFLDRSPINPKRAAESCHIAIMGDSFVEALQVDIEHKAQVKLEELAARELPHLDVTTSAFGLSATGQINQLGFYDEYARHLKPKIVALVFVNNDFGDNSTILTSLAFGLDPDHMPRVTATRGAYGALKLRPPDPDYEAFRLPPPPRTLQSSIRHNSAVERTKNEVTKYSYFANWLDLTIRWMFPNKVETLKAERTMWWAELLSQRTRYSTILQGWPPSGYAYIDSGFGESDMPPVFEDALPYTKFAIEQFKQRAERDGAKIVILAIHRMKMVGDGLYFARLNAIAQELDIPIVDHYEYIISIGADPRNAQRKYDTHWSENGHLWAAEALLEWLRDNQEACGERD